MSVKNVSSHLISEMIPGTEIGLKLIKYYFKMPLVRWSLELEAFELKEPNRK
jgi:hypothetical protein